MGLESLKGRRERCKLKWWCKVNNLNAERYPRLLLDSVSGKLSRVGVGRGRPGGK